MLAELMQIPIPLLVAFLTAATFYIVGMVVGSSITKSKYLDKINELEEKIRKEAKIRQNLQNQ